MVRTQELSKIILWTGDNLREYSRKLNVAVLHFLGLAFNFAKISWL